MTFTILKLNSITTLFGTVLVSINCNRIPESGTLIGAGIGEAVAFICIGAIGAGTGTTIGAATGERVGCLVAFFWMGAIGAFTGATTGVWIGESVV